MAVIDTSRSAADYSKAIKQLLPPGKYWESAHAGKVTDTLSEELARIHTQIDTKFTISASKVSIGWKRSDWEQILTDAGLSDFKVTSNHRLGFIAGDNTSTQLGSFDNLKLIFISYPINQLDLFTASIPTLQAHKLTDTRIQVCHPINISGLMRCGELNDHLLV
ncbi:hypothetical protein [Bathymodiolus septemdierum thioautotrophic gill symbiont]|uniref:Uncharacterized protein n=1 Tax=endosymbiont of Bathymodiolus septemdierum str. Myojin knoll TaxID=1303921 RepID=A0A0P0URE3_9GAMM|nr:hypothetical protein [Bathymodiolus septemdierum thioautotrophic gill symbiont]BAS67628.1 hypothetical protein BSEPE_0624 [endosymbiont of Bathymodiolus septemdierum str. Myojin knoll]